MALSKALTTVLVFSISFSPLMTPKTVLAQSETAESGSSNNTIRLPSLNGGRRNQTRYNFRAADYFYPIKPGVDRTHLPERLTFETVRDIDLEGFKAQLSKQPWKMVFHCKGRALTVEMFSKGTLFDGIMNQSAVSEFSFNGNGGAINQTLYAPEINPDNLPDSETVSGAFKGMRLSRPGEASFTYEDDFVYNLRMVRVRETNEMLLHFTSEDEDDKICPDGDTPELLLVPSPNGLLS